MKTSFLLPCPLIFIICISFTTNLRAQQYYGIYAGINHTTIDHYYGSKEGNLPAFEEVEGKYGYQLGLFWMKRKEGRFAWHHEMYFNMRSAHVQYSNYAKGSHERLDLDLNFVYLNYTFLPQFHFFDDPDLFINLGPYIGGKVISTAKGSRVLYTSFGEVEEQIDGDADRYFPALDLGVNAGIGIILNLSEKDRLLLEVRDSFGFIADGPTTNEALTQANTISLNAAYVFGPRSDRKPRIVDE